MTPNLVNRAHWPTKENWQKFCFFVFFRSMEKMPWNGTKWGQEDFFLLIQTLPTFWAERIWILRICIFWICWTPNFWISRSPDFQKSGLGQASQRSCGQLVWGAIWTKKCWFFSVNRDVWARDPLFRLGETRASVTKYWFFLIKMNDECPANVSRPLCKTVRTPHRKLCLGNFWC